MSRPDDERSARLSELRYRVDRKIRDWFRLDEWPRPEEAPEGGRSDEEVAGGGHDPAAVPDRLKIRQEILDLIGLGRRGRPEPQTLDNRTLIEMLRERMGGANPALNASFQRDFLRDSGLELGDILRERTEPAIEPGELESSDAYYETLHIETGFELSATHPEIVKHRMKNLDDLREADTRLHEIYVICNLSGRSPDELSEMFGDEGRMTVDEARRSYELAAKFVHR